MLLALAPAVREPVGLTVSVLLPLRVLEGVPLPLPVGVSVLLPVAVPLALQLAVPLLLSEVLPVLEALAPAERELVGDTVTVLLPLTVLEGVGAAVPELL